MRDEKACVFSVENMQDRVWNELLYIEVYLHNYHPYITSTLHGRATRAGPFYHVTTWSRKSK